VSIGDKIVKIWDEWRTWRIEGYIFSVVLGVIFLSIVLFLIYFVSPTPDYLGVKQPVSGVIGIAIIVVVSIPVIGLQRVLFHMLRLREKGKKREPA